MQVKLTPEAVVAVFNANPSTVSKHIREMRAALVTAAQLVPWLQDIDRSNVTSHLRVIIEVANAMGSAQHEATQADTGEKNGTPSPDQCAVLECSVAAGDAQAKVYSQQPASTQNVCCSRKRQRCEDQPEHQNEAACYNSLAVRVQSAQHGSAFVVADLDSKQFAEEMVIMEHEWPQYIHMPKRLRCCTGSHTKNRLHADIQAC